MMWRGLQPAGSRLISTRAAEKSFCATFLCALLFTGCMVGPKYSKPAVAASPAFNEPPPQSFAESEGWKQAQPADTTLRADWWQLFGIAELNRLEEQIDANNQNLKAAEARFREARALIQVNRSNLYPTISTSPSITTNRLSRNAPTGSLPGDYGQYTLPIDVNYELDAWGRVRRSVAAAREEAQASASDLETIRLSLHAELAVDYFELRGLDSEKNLLDETIGAYQKALNLTQHRYDGGLSSKAEVAQARTQLETTRAEDIGVGVSRATYQHAIAVLLGRNPESLTLEEGPLNYRAAGDSRRRTGPTSGAASRHRRCGTPDGRGQRADRHRAGGFLSAVAAHRYRRFPGQYTRRLAELAEPLLVGRACARADHLRRRQAARRRGVRAGVCTTRQWPITGRRHSPPSRK